jgi:hypothetical protein
MGKKKAAKKAANKGSNFVPKKDIEAEKEPVDFGGIPNRDLKKNLGCG